MFISRRTVAPKLSTEIPIIHLPTPVQLPYKERFEECERELNQLKSEHYKTLSGFNETWSNREGEFKRYLADFESKYATQINELTSQAREYRFNIADLNSAINNKDNEIKQITNQLIDCKGRVERLMDELATAIKFLNEQKNISERSSVAVNLMEEENQKLTNELSESKDLVVTLAERNRALERRLYASGKPSLEELVASSSRYSQ